MNANSDEWIKYYFEFSNNRRKWSDYSAKRLRENDFWRKKNKNKERKIEKNNRKHSTFSPSSGNPENKQMYTPYYIA